MPGIFTLSLDVELYWGIRDVVSLETARARLLGDREVVPRLLDLFVDYDVRATWAAVGFLFFDGRDALMAALPAILPHYRQAGLDPYPIVSGLGPDEKHDPFHFAPSLIKRIADASNQELATHTFSHFYCLEEGQTVDAFGADISAAVAAASRYGARIESLVFPRNQFNERYLDTCAKLGIIAYRGNPSGWMYRPSTTTESRFKRGARLLDAYVSLSGKQAFAAPPGHSRLPVNVPASRFLRPWSRRLAPLVPFQLRRIRAEMTAAAKTSRLYHLWWHPHNFGLDQSENLELTRELLEHYRRLNDEYGFESLAMRDVARRWIAHEHAA